MRHPLRCRCEICESVVRQIFGPVVEQGAAALATLPEAVVYLHPLLASRGADPEVEAIAARAGGRWVICGTHVELAR